MADTVTQISPPAARVYGSPGPIRRMLERLLRYPADTVRMCLKVCQMAQGCAWASDLHQPDAPGHEADGYQMSHSATMHYEPPAGLLHLRQGTVPNTTPHRIATVPVRQRRRPSLHVRRMHLPPRGHPSRLLGPASWTCRPARSAGQQDQRQHRLRYATTIDEVTPRRST